MKKIIEKLSKLTFLLLLAGIVITSCKEDEDTTPENKPTGNSETFTIDEVSPSGVSGTVKFEELTDKSTRVTISLSGAVGGHPAHIHINTAAETGAIAISLTVVDASGASVTDVSAMDDGTSISYSQLVEFDGYVNVHKSSSELGISIAQGDIGKNALTGSSMDYELFEAAVSGISGKVTFSERENGEALVTIVLAGTSAGGDHPAHIHLNTVAEGGSVAVALTNVDGNSGMSNTNVSKLADDSPIMYSDWADFNGYVQVHNSSSDLGTIIASGDIGMNQLTGDMETYMLNAKSDPNITGTAKFEKRKSGATLVTLMLENTAMDASHPAHIHINTAAEGGSIAVSLAAVDGESGLSWTSVSELNDQTAITYDELVEFNGYINVHNSMADLGTLVAQGDIGQNALTENKKEYTMHEQNASGVSGTVTFYERNNGFTLVALALMGTVDGGDHPSHIHSGSMASPGGVAISLTNVNGKTGMSMTSVTKLNDETEMKYSDLIVYAGYAQVHKSGADLATILTNGDTGSNVD